MTDITELAQRLKLEVHRAVSDFNPQMNIKTRDLKELVEALESRSSGLMNWRTMKFVNGWLTQSTNSTWLNWLKII
ncbi:hypothetical protein LNO55_12705 [Klebsiella pneumoniae subsp. pneumoniae]|nr:hypothetical protein [Klebsiella pneumoniae subsp. pneumoniae]